MNINGEKAYPIYKFSFTWTHDGEHDLETKTKYPDSWMYKDLPLGRKRNSTGFSIMKEVEMTEDEIKEFVSSWWKSYVDKKGMTDINPELEPVHHRMYYETWVCSWFQHETFDVGQTDREALISFDKYVRRHESEQGDYELKKDHEGHPILHISLMGAEDRWRWRGADDAEGNHTPAPCRCEHCKRAGKIRIAH
jgi:hypothetical protein